MTTRRQKIRRTLLALFFLALPITLNYYSPYLMTSGTAERVATFSLVFWLSVFVSAFVLAFGVPSGLRSARPSGGK